MLNISRPHRPSDRASGGVPPPALRAGETAHVDETGCIAPPRDDVANAVSPVSVSSAAPVREAASLKPQRALAARPSRASASVPLGRVFQRSAAPGPLAQEAMQAAARVTDKYILFTPPQGQAPSRGLVLLGGAKVQEESYAPLAKALAERGIAVSIVRSPFDLPFLVPLFGQRLDAAMGALRESDANLPLTVGGHSAGGFVATLLGGRGADDLLLMNARATGRSRPVVRGLAVFGAQDGLISPAEREETGRALPSVEQVVIEGLDHDFRQGLYGAQQGDPVEGGDPQALVNQVADVISARLGRVQ